MPIHNCSYLACKHNSTQEKLAHMPTPQGQCANVASPRSTYTNEARMTGMVTSARESTSVTNVVKAAVSLLRDVRWRPADEEGRFMA